MRKTVLTAAAATLFAAMGGLAACSSPPPVRVPASLLAPAGQALYLEAFATGVQVYECAAAAPPASGFGWRFVAPEATLADASGKVLGKHYAGPTWESVDGSKVVGTLVRQDPGPEPSAIPWLLLTAKSHAGDGVMAQATSIQRIRTAGGGVPATACDASKLGQAARVPYTATYDFYRAAVAPS